MPFNLSLTMRATTVSCVVHRFSTNFLYIVQISVKSSVPQANSITNPVNKSNTSLWICIEGHISARFTFRTIFHKSTASIKVITSINLKIKMYQF